MPYSSRILVAALLLLGTAQAGSKALALPQPALVSQAQTPVPVPDPGSVDARPQSPEVFTLAQQPDTPPATSAQGGTGFSWWWLLPIAAGGGALAWAVSRRGSAEAEDLTSEKSASPSPTAAIPEPTAATPEPAATIPEPAATIPEPTATIDPEPATTIDPEPTTTIDPEPAAIIDPEPPTLAAIPADSVPAVPASAASDPPGVEPPPTPVIAVEEVAPSPEADPWLDSEKPEEPEELAAAPDPLPPVAPAPAVADMSAPLPPPEDVEVAPDESPAGPVVESIPVPQPSAVPVMASPPELTTEAAAAMVNREDQSAIEAHKFDVVGQPTDGGIDLSSIDDGLPPLPDGYGESRIVLMPRDPQWAYTYWDIPHTHKENLRHQGGERLALRLYDVTDIDRDYQSPHGMQQCDCDELARDWYLQIPVSDRDYQVEIGYLAGDGRWLLLARSNTIRIPPIYPSDWSEDHFKTVTWDDNLQGKTLMTLVDPHQTSRSLHEQMYAISQAGEAERVDGSIYGSMPHVPGSMPHVPGSMQQVAGSIQHIAGSITPYQSAESSYAWGASGAGLLQGMPGPGSVVPTVSGMSMMSGVGMGVSMSGVGMSGVGMSGVGMSGVGMSGVGMGVNVSGLNMSGISGLTLSGVGFSASMPPARPRQFWLVADAELIVYGSTEPDATVTMAGQPIQLSPEGTFRVHTSFPDGNIDYPIMAVAADGEQNRSIHMTFDRQTLDRRTNTKEEAQDEWFEG